MHFDYSKSSAAISFWFSLYGGLYLPNCFAGFIFNIWNNISYLEISQLGGS